MAFTASNLFGKAFTPVTLEVLFPSTFASGFLCQRNDFHDSLQKKRGVRELSEGSWGKNVFGKNQ